MGTSTQTILIKGRILKGWEGEMGHKRGKISFIV